jgi:DNA primase
MKLLLVDILESFLGEHKKHNDDTGQIAFDCPACSAEKGLIDGDGKGNLEINYNKGIFKCWACQETNNMHGPVIKLLKKYATPKNIRDYLLVKPDTDLVNDKEKKSITLTLPEGYKKLSECTDKDYKSKIALNYLYERGITDEIIKYYDIGYTIRGKFFNRVIIPSYDSEGNLNYFIARWFPKEYTKLKYLNPDVEKQDIIFNEAKINWDSTIYIVEGATDHIVVPNSIPLLGKYISPQLLDLLQEKAKAYVVIVLDDDAFNDAKRLYRELNFGELRNRIKLVRCPDGYDPSKIYEKLGNKGIIKLLMGAYKLDDSEIY